MNPSEQLPPFNQDLVYGADFHLGRLTYILRSYTAYPGQINARATYLIRWTIRSLFRTAVDAGFGHEARRLMRAHLDRPGDLVTEL